MNFTASMKFIAGIFKGKNELHSLDEVDSPYFRRAI